MKGYDRGPTPGTQFRVFSYTEERGQVLVIFVFGLLALLFFLTLVLDGGFLLLRRREAQVAADAASLAGVVHLCGSSPDTAAAMSTAEDYATVQNSALTASVSFPSASRISVLAGIDQPPSFAGLLGFGSLNVIADAAAECIPAGSASGPVLPVAWSCRPPVEGSDSEDCAIKYGDEHIYVVLDSDPADEQLKCNDPPNSGGTPEHESGDMDCDIDNDGIDDAIDAGNRGWLDLDGGNGNASETNNWIKNGFNGLIQTHTWYPGNPGAYTTSFQQVRDELGPDYPIVIVPIFSEFCPDAFDPEVNCPDKWHEPPDPQDEVIIGSGVNFYYHVSGFALFQITCVYSGGSDEQCPGRQRFGFETPGTPKTIEGYFIEGTHTDLGFGIADDAGAYYTRLYD